MEGLVYKSEHRGDMSFFNVLRDGPRRFWQL